VNDRLKVRCGECRTSLDLHIGDARLVQDPQGEWTGLEYDCSACVARVRSALHPEMGRHLQQRGVPAQVHGLTSERASGELLGLAAVDAFVALLERPAEEVFADLAGATTLRPRWARWLR
jgi:hypothetical protein